MTSIVLWLIGAACSSPGEEGPRCRRSARHDFVGPGHADFCRRADRILIGEVRDGVPHPDPPLPNSVARTAVHFRLSHVVAGPGAPGDTLVLTIPGGLKGEFGGVVAGISYERDRDYLLFVEDRPRLPEPFVLSSRLIPADAFYALPPQDVLAERWSRLCAANPEGVHPDDRPEHRLLTGECLSSVH